MCLTDDHDSAHTSLKLCVFLGALMLALLLFGLLPFAFSGIIDDGADDATQDEADTGDDTLPGGSPGGLDDLGGNSGGGSGGGASGGPSGSDDNDVQFGTDGNDSLTGASGEDLLIGQGGDDLLRGGRGEDLLAGFSGNDFLKGDAGDDVAIGGAGNDTVWGMDDDDALFGNGGNDVLAGGDGDDALADFSGSDTLRGGAGNDILTAIDQTDKITATDLLPTGLNGMSASAFRGALIQSFGSDDVSETQIATLFAEVRSGERTTNSPDLLEGGAGNDALVGDDADTMTGGTGDDLFAVYTDPSQALSNKAVTITDLDPSTDQLLISVEDDGKGVVSLAADSAGLGTQVLYRGDAVALISGKSPADLTAFLPKIVVEVRVDL